MHPHDQRLAEWSCAACRGDNPAGMRFCGHCGTRRETPSEVAARAQEAGNVEERRLVTSLFADISGFTTLADRLDVEELHAIIEPVIAGLAAIAERYDGFIAKYAGDALLVFFGAPVAHEDDPVRAQLVALEMHEALPGLVAELPTEAHGLELHIGVNTGRVVAGRFGGEIQSDYSILGDAVILAQRLESVCPSGETYVGETTVELSGDLFAYEPLGELSLKGKLRPVPAYRLLGRRDTPEASTNRGRTNRLVGRTRELGEVDAVLGRLRGGTGGVLGLTGEPGVGKSRLLEEVQRRAASRGVRWLQARCISYGSGIAYWPYTDLLRRSLGLDREDPAATALPRLAAVLGDRHDALPYLARLLGTETGDPSVVAMSPAAFRRGLHQAIVTWLEVLAATTPVVLAVEDLHWADSSSLALTGDLLRSTASAPLVVCATARPEGGDLVESLVVGAGDRGNHVRLGPLDEGSLGSLAAELLGGDSPPELVALLVERTAGNPLFAQEVVRALVDEGTLERSEAGRWRMRLGWDRDAVPPTVERVLAARIDALPATTAQVLQTTAVIGRLIRRSLLDGVLADVDDLDSELAQLLERGFLDPAVDGTEEAVIFHHALVHEVAYARLLRRHRRDLHRRVADVAERLYGDTDDLLDLLAHHLYLGDAGDRAVTYLRRAGDRARRLFANDQVILHLGRAVEVTRSLPDVDEAALGSLLLELGRAQDVAGAYVEAGDAYVEATHLVADVRAWRGHAAALRKRGRFAEAVEVLDEALERPDLQGSEAALWLERADVLVAEGRYADAVETARRGLDAAGNDDSVRAELLLQLARAEEAQGLFDAAHDHAGEALERFEPLGELHGVAAALRAVGGIQLGQGRLDDAVVTLHRGLELAERTGEVEELASCLLNLGQVERQRGNVDDAVTCSRRALEQFERLGHTTGCSLGAVNLAELLLERGDLAEARRHCDDALTIAEAAGIALLVADAHALRARIAGAEDRHEEAALEGEEAGRRYVELELPDDAAAAFAAAAEAWSRCGDDGRAAAARARVTG